MTNTLARFSCDQVRGQFDAVLRTLAELPRSAEPAVVLTELARRCVPICCDSCIISIDPVDQDGYRLRWPPAEADLDGPVGGEPDRLPPEQQVPTNPRLAERELQVVARTATGSYAMTWTYRRHQPSDADLLLAQLALDRAIATSRDEQLRARAEAAEEQAAHLQVGLTSSREIGMAMGIAMDRYKLSPDQAFTLLCRISQQCGRRVREVAAQVAETGLVELPKGYRSNPDRPARGPAT